MKNPDRARRLLIEARRLLIDIGDALEHDRPLTLTQRRYLIDSAKRAAEGDKDPLGLHRRPGDRSDKAMQIYIAQKVHALVKQGVPPTHAYDVVAEEVHLSGGSDGAVAKAYRARKAELEGAEAVYTAHNAQRKMTDDEREQSVKGLETLMKPRKSRNS
jgi:hypothetical protein